MTDQTNVEPKATKTNAEKLVVALAYVAKLQGLIAAETALNNTQVNDVVEFKFGRKENARVLTGTVQGIKLADADTPRALAKIVSGEGFDAQIFKVALVDIVRNETAEAREAVENDAAEDAGQAEVEAVDPTTEA